MKRFALLMAVSAVVCLSALNAFAEGTVEELDCYALNALGTSTLTMDAKTHEIHSTIYSMAGVYTPKLQVMAVQAETKELRNFASTITLSEVAEKEAKQLTLAFYDKIPLGKRATINGWLLMEGIKIGVHDMPVASISCNVLVK